MDARLESLEARVGRLEHAMAGLRRAEPAPPTIPPPPQAGEPGLISPPQFAPSAPPAEPPQAVGPRPPDTEREAILAGTWLARVGISAVLLGAAFAFKYAVDRGLIGPGGRVALGVAAGLAFVIWGERARARDWPRLAQAVAGGGVGLVYLSVWAAFGLYELIPPAAAFAFLVVIVAGGAALALHHRSESLALVALLGAFLNPYLTGIERLPGPLFAYVLLVDLGVAALALVRGWRLVEAKAVAATWLVAMIATEGVAVGLVQTFAAAAFLLFSTVVLARTGRERKTEPLDLVVLSANAVAFFGVSMAVLGEVGEHARGDFTLLLAGVHLGAGLLLRRFEWPRQLWVTLLGLGVGFATVAIPLRLDGFQIPIAWAIEAVALGAAGRPRGTAVAKWLGVAVLGLSLLDGLVFRMQLGFSYDPHRAVFSIESLTLLVQVAALYATSRLLKAADDDPPAAAWSSAAWVGAHLLTIGWLSLEARAVILRSGVADPERLAHFTLTTLWSVYAVGLLGLAVAFGRRHWRPLAVGLLGVAMVKLALIDLLLRVEDSAVPPFVSAESVMFLLQIVALSTMTLLLRGSKGDARERSVASIGWVGANLLTLVWLSLETRVALAHADIGDPHRVVQFSFTAIWGLYAGLLLTVGIVSRRRGLRLLAITIFGLTAAKMAVVDLWLLDPLHRTIAFTGLGLLLLLGSLLYHRFRDLILEGRT